MTSAKRNVVEKDLAEENFGLEDFVAAPPLHEGAPSSGGWLTQRLRSEFLAFVLVGGFSAAVNVLGRFILEHWMDFTPAIILAYLVGMATAFTLSRLLVFADAQSGDGRAQFLRFALVNVAAVLQVWAISVGLGDYLFPRLGLTMHAHDLAHMIGVAVPAVTSYLGHKWFSFR